MILYMVQSHNDKKIENWFFIRLDSRCNRTKKVIKLVGNVNWFRNSLLLLKIILGDSDSLIFKKVINLIPFQVFLILLILFLK